LLRPALQLRQAGRLVFQAQAQFGRLQVRVTGTAKPDVGLGVVFFSNQLRQRLARTLHRDIDFGPGGLGVDRPDHVAPLGLHRTDDVDRLGVNSFFMIQISV